MIGNRARRRATRPAFEPLEGRLLLHAATGSKWTLPARITYSIVPDGTSIGGVPSNLQATLNARFGAGAWQSVFTKAAAAWQKVAKVNFALVPDDGSPIGAAGYQQGDGRFGDIRIGGFSQASNQLAFAFVPPPSNGGSHAGDIFINTTQSWQVNGTTYDLMTVALHEFGHALGLDHTTATSAAELWAAYNGSKQALHADDIDGIRSIYAARQGDAFDANGANNSASTADDLAAYVDGTGRLSLAGLDITTPLTVSAGDVDWFRITVPATTTGTVTVRMQSAGLSVLSPSLAVYNAAGTTILGQQSSQNFGATVAVTLNGVTSGQTYLVRAAGATTGTSGYGAYGLQVNFGAWVQAPIAPPVTAVAAQPDMGSVSKPQEETGTGLLGLGLGGIQLNLGILDVNIDLGIHLITIGSLSGYGVLETTGHRPIGVRRQGSARTFSGPRPSASRLFSQPRPSAGDSQTRRRQDFASRRPTVLSRRLDEGRRLQQALAAQLGLRPRPAQQAIEPAHDGTDP